MHYCIIDIIVPSLTVVRENNKESGINKGLFDVFERKRKAYVKLLLSIFSTTSSGKLLITQS